MEDIGNNFKLLSSITVPFNLPKGICYNFYIDGKSCYAFVSEENNKKKIMFSESVGEESREVIKKFLQKRFMECV